MRQRRRLPALPAFLAAIVFAIALQASAPASAAVPPKLTQFPDNAARGSAANQLEGGFAAATDPVTGELYVGEPGNRRISVFTPWGEFVKAFGWDVAPGAVNEQQEVRLRATAGSFQLSFGASSTPDLPFNASGGEVEAALNDLPSINAGGGGVEVRVSPGSADGATPSVYVIAFTAGPLAGVDVAEVVASQGTTPLTGGSPSTTLEVRTRADGTAGGSGLEACTGESGCQAGASGAGPGQFGERISIAVDSSGGVYVEERSSQRVQKFSPAGKFLLMFGGQVNKSTNANVCTAASGDTCGVGVAGTGDGEFSFSIQRGATIAIDPAGTVYVSDPDRIQQFDFSGLYKSETKFSELHVSSPDFPSSGDPRNLAFDSHTGDLYLTLRGPDSMNSPIYGIDPVMETVREFVVPSPLEGRILGLVTDDAGNLFVAFDSGPHGFPEQEPRIIELAADGTVLIPFEEEFGAPLPVPEIEFGGLAMNSVGDLYVLEYGFNPVTATVSAYGPLPLALAPPPKAPPSILEQFATSVDASGAMVKAKINPRFWSDTTYHVEYGEQSCAVSACSRRPAQSGLRLTNEVVNGVLPSSGILLDGLEPGTTYHYRLVAQSSGGGPAIGLSGKSGEEAEGTFTTMPEPAFQPPCPGNDRLRTGSSALLPDCRAYEMVSPVDKEGADIGVLFNVTGYPAGLDQSEPGGDRLTYSAYRAFGGIQSSPYTSQYLADRDPSRGWSSRSISPPREGASLLSTPGLDSQYKGFSEDLCQGWLLQDTDNALAEGSVSGFADLYHRDICGDEFETLAPFKAPEVKDTVEFRPEVQGTSADGSKTIFLAGGKLTNNAIAAPQLYESEEGGVLRLVCVLPSKAALKSECTAGTLNRTAGDDRGASLANAISEDGSRIYWAAAVGSPGKLYVRVDHSETIEVSSKQSRFWAASADGSKAFYSVDSDLFEFDLASKSSTAIAGGFQGFLGAGEDASKAYFLSTEALAPGASAGDPNLYLFSAGEPSGLTFIATLADADAGEFGPGSVLPVQHTSQVNPDGDAVAFMSRGSLTGQDNTDLASGQPDAQVYLYRAGPDELTCASCNTTGARPTGRDIRAENQLKKTFWAAAQIPAAQNQLHYPRVLSEDGNRLFFESFDSLSLRDTNGQKDVYEWEAQGTGNCTPAAPGYNNSYNGCVNLISSGESPQGSEILETSADGRDLFFKTAESLLPQDPGLVDIYDARSGGGFPQPPSPPAPCEGEACQQPLGPPSDRTPSSASFNGPGDQVAKKKKKAKAKKKGKQGKGKQGKGKKGRGKAKKQKARRGVGQR